ncbi:hypothetical protein MVEN_00102100 [Mycena venus]|uniref:Uncharacterized protein n=1 Tax=Mycena venus TaxID=2733690 RepID=A0A8H6ZB21_9AGAR|nr:hypothetical protein MVEN_00102100 [Mycena venus]
MAPTHPPSSSDLDRLATYARGSSGFIVSLQTSTFTPHVIPAFKSISWAPFYNPQAHSADLGSCARHHARHYWRCCGLEFPTLGTMRTLRPRIRRLHLVERDPYPWVALDLDFPGCCWDEVRRGRRWATGAGVCLRAPCERARCGCLPYEANGARGGFEWGWTSTRATPRRTYDEYYPNAPPSAAARTHAVPPAPGQSPRVRPPRACAVRTAAVTHRAWWVLALPAPRHHTQRAYGSAIGWPWRRRCWGWECDSGGAYGRRGDEAERLGAQEVFQLLHNRYDYVTVGPGEGAVQ